MNQKEFLIIAGVLRDMYDMPLWHDVTGITIFKFTEALEQNYPKTFDRDKFMKACGL